MSEYAPYPTMTLECIYAATSMYEVGQIIEIINGYTYRHGQRSHSQYKSFEDFQCRQYSRFKIIEGSEYKVDLL